MRRPALALLALVVASTSSFAQGSFDPAVAAGLRYRYIGPVGNRSVAVVGIPGDPNVYYAGAASGGIWKTTDGGINWQPIFDNQQVSSIGALAIARSNPNIVWAGTGEPFIRSHISLGNGVYKSEDAGRTWKRMGLDSSGRIGRIVIDPTNPNVVLVAAQGHSYGPQQQRGVFRTRDGGNTWERVLFVDENTGAIDLAMDPTNPQVIFAGLWQLLIRTWGRESGGPGSGLYVSRDGGTTWTQLKGNGLPVHVIGKIGLSIAPSNPKRIYALIETGDGIPYKGQPTDNGELWRSDDGGSTWKVVSYDRNLACRQPYYTRVVTSSDNPDEAYFMCATFSRTMDGGVTNRGAGGGGGGEEGEGGGAAARQAAAGPPLSSPGGDQHDMWIDPTNANRMIVGNDQNVAISTTRGRTWLRTNLPIAQMYHVTVDDRIPYYVYGNRQDGPSYRGPSNSRSGGSIQRSAWHGVLGGESGFATPDPVDSNVIWSTASGSGSRGGIVVRFDQRNRHGQNVEVYPLSTGGYPAADVKYRFIWNAPFLISPHNHLKVYTGSQYVHESTNGGRSWRVISPDLTRNDKSRQQSSGGLTPDNIGVEYGGTLMAINESRLRRGVIWTGSNDGRVYVTRDSGTTWTNVTPLLPEPASWGSVQHVEPSRFDVNTAYVTVDAHQEGNFDPWIYRTKDLGRTWELIVNGIPKSFLSYAHVIREDPVRRGLLYAGTENALYVSINNGDKWEQLNNNLPPAPVYGMVIQERFNDLVVATYGRGFWILDDLTPLQRLTPEVMASTGHLFPIRPAYRWRDVPGNYNMDSDQTAGQNPPYGAAINYWAKDTGQVRVEILDSANKVIRTQQTTARAGLNRVYWNLQNDTTRSARMRTKPEYNEEYELNADGTRPAPGVGGITVLMPPGRYTARLTIAGTAYSQPLEVKKDPNNMATLVEIHEQNRALLALQRDHAATTEMINTIENVRGQLEALRKTIASDAGKADTRTATDSLEAKFKAVESRIVDLRMTGRGQDGVRWPVMLAGQIDYVAGTIESSDFAPTVQQKEVAAVLAKQTRDTHALLRNLMARDLANFNSRLRSQGLKTIDVPMPEIVF
ncbi:MAG TPA: hypothetical protein VFT29_16680 [Gemmatimonadaceae bacterium]|nr:hypothetical protein [Gemmatimonadaceae bacterium]